MTPNGHAVTPEPQPLHTSACTITVSNSVRISAPVGHASRQPAFVQCLHTSDMKIHFSISGEPPAASAQPTRSTSCSPSATDSTKRTCRHVDALNEPVESYEPRLPKPPPSAGRSFHCLHATSHALQPMHTVVSVKKPIRAAAGRSTAISVNGPLRPGVPRLLRPVVLVRLRCVLRPARRAVRLAGLARTPPRSHVARERLVLDRHVRVARERHEVV